MPKGFGVKLLKKDDKLVKQAVSHCKQRCPNKLDKIFDALIVGRTKAEHQDAAYILINALVAALNNDIESTCWFCGYFARELNRVEDKEKHGRIEKLSQTLIESGMQPFSDFVPFPGWHIIIVNTKKFKTLPVDIQQAVQHYQASKNRVEEAQVINDANIPS
jgi:hypothetical protein